MLISELRLARRREKRPVLVRDQLVRVLLPDRQAGSLVGNQITASLFLHIQLIISYCHQTGSGDKKSGGANEGGQGGQAAAAAAPSPHLQVKQHTRYYSFLKTL